jgi:hypothetical protein
VRRDERFKNLKNIVQLSVMLVETNRHEQYFVVYKLLKGRGVSELELICS